MFVMGIGCKFIGFARQMLLANCFGTGDVVDAYLMAQAIPSILLGGVLVAFSTAYLPLMSKRYETQGRIEANRYTNKVLVLIFLLSFIVTFIGGYFAMEIVQVFSPGLNPSARSLTSLYLKFTFGYTFFNATIGILSNYLEYQGVFTKLIIGDYIQNVFFILFIWVGFVAGNYLLILGPFLGCIFRWIYLYVLAYRNGLRFFLDNNRVIEVFQEIMLYALPVFLGTTAFEINAYVDKYLATGLASGSVSALGFAHQLGEAVMTLTITILATILYPKMLKSVLNNQIDAFGGYVSRGMDLCAIISIPISIGGILYSNEIIRLIFERGAFVAASTTMTADAYFFYSIGIFFLAENTFITKVFYSLGDMRTPTVCATIGVIVNIIGDLVLVNPMGINGLAIATSIAAIVNAMMLLLFLKVKFQVVNFIDRAVPLIKIFIATMLSGGGGYIFYYLCRQVFQGGFEVLFCFALIISSFGYILVLKRMHFDEIENVVRMLVHESK